MVQTTIAFRPAGDPAAFATGGIHLGPDFRCTGASFSPRVGLLYTRTRPATLRNPHSCPLRIIITGPTLPEPVEVDELNIQLEWRRRELDWNGSGTNG